VAERSIRQAGGEAPGAPEDPYFLDTMSIPEEEKAGIRERLAPGGGRVDPVVSFLVAATNGMAYRRLLGKLDEYPVPELRLPPGDSQLFLDIGCSWGRWCIAAARLGYRPIGIDPSLGAVLTAQRIANQLGLDIKFVVGDARFLPFRSEALDVVFSYSVIQHFSRQDAVRAIQEVGRTLRPDGVSLIQMPSVLGLRCLYHQARRGFRRARDFEVRYWSWGELRRVFSRHIGPTAFSVDCFFGLGLQAADLHLMPPAYRALIRASEFLRRASNTMPWLRYAADSLYVESGKPGPGSR
jgi:SAM-dependent methyltransferase